MRYIWQIQVKISAKLMVFRYKRVHTFINEITSYINKIYNSIKKKSKWNLLSSFYLSNF